MGILTGSYSICKKIHIHPKNHTNHGLKASYKITYRGCYFVVSVVATDSVSLSYLKGVSTAREVYEVLSHRGWLELFPLFATVHEICVGHLPPSAIVEYSERKPRLSLLEGSTQYYWLFPQIEVIYFTYLRYSFESKLFLSCAAWTEAKPRQTSGC